MAQAPGKVLLASLMRTKSLLDLAFRREVPHSDPKHTMKTKRHRSQVQMGKSFIFKWRKEILVNGQGI